MTKCGQHSMIMPPNKINFERPLLSNSFTKFSKIFLFLVCQQLNASNNRYLNFNAISQMIFNPFGQHWQRLKLLLHLLLSFVTKEERIAHVIQERILNYNFMI